MGSVGFPLKLSARILIFLILENFCVTCVNAWCYNDPKCGPNTWGPIGSCSGKRQSPINIDTRTVKTKSSLGPLHFFHYEDLDLVRSMTNTGYQCRVDFKVKAMISGGGLSANYYLHQMHIHWGTENSNGGEHTVDGKRHNMEMHLVHTKSNMSVEEASKLPDGLAVLSFPIEKSQVKRQITSWNALAKLFNKIPEKGNTCEVKGEYSLAGLLTGADVNHYFHYEGSLTTPPCGEAVLWFHLKYPLIISYEVATIMTTTLYYTTIQEKKVMQNNFRPTQPLNGRDVYYYSEHNGKSLLACIGYCFTRYW